MFACFSLVGFELNIKLYVIGFFCFNFNKIRFRKYKSRLFVGFYLFKIRSKYCNGVFKGSYISNYELKILLVNNLEQISQINKKHKRIKKSTFSARENHNVKLSLFKLDSSEADRQKQQPRPIECISINFFFSKPFCILWLQKPALLRTCVHVYVLETLSMMYMIIRI